MSSTETAAAPLGEERGTIYNQVFWLTYIANVSLVTANALTFRFAELVAYLGGSEQVAGTITSLGMGGAILARLVLGQAIDRYGTRKLWILGSVLFTGGCAAFLLCNRLAWEIYAARVAFNVGLAGMFTCSMVHIQNQVPAERRTEIIASLGSSGFVGMITGAQLGDWIFYICPDGRLQFLVLFGGAAALGILYFGIVVHLTRGDVHRRPAETPAAHRLIFRYWPGSVVLVALMMGIGVTVTTVFLTRFATHLHLSGIGTFFTAYATSAFLFRVASRRWSRVIGRHSLILMGLAGHGIGFGILPMVTEDWHFILPAVLSGFGHALLFPAVVSLGAGRFPTEYRGSGTTLVLGFVEMGAMLSGPLLGGMIDHIGFAAMFYSAAGTALIIAAVYAVTGARVPDDDLLRPEEGNELSGTGEPESSVLPNRDTEESRPIAVSVDRLDPGA